MIVGTEDGSGICEFQLNISMVILLIILYNIYSYILYYNNM